jgi:hypothetical protein
MEKSFWIRNGTPRIKDENEVFNIILRKLTERESRSIDEVFNYAGKLF